MFRLEFLSSDAVVPMFLVFFRAVQDFCLGQKKYIMLLKYMTQVFSYLVLEDPICRCDCCHYPSLKMRKVRFKDKAVTTPVKSVTELDGDSLDSQSSQHFLPLDLMVQRKEGHKRTLG